MSTAPRRLVHAVLAAVTILLAAPAASPGASPGDPHPVFATFQQHVGPATGQESATDVVVQPDGSVLVSILNDAEVDPRIIRLLPSGVLDPTFGVGGIWTVPTPSNTYIRAISLQADGKIVYAGINASAPAIVIGRLTPTGQPDITFASDGEYVLSTPANSAPLVEDVFVESTGNVTFAGIIRNGARLDDLFMGRLTGVGTDDPNFAGAQPIFLFGSPYDGDPDGFGGITQMPNGDYIVGNPHGGTASQIWRINSTAGSRVAANVAFPSSFNKPIDVMPIDATHAVVLLEGAHTSGLAYLDVTGTPVIDQTGAVGNAGTIQPFPSSFRGHELLRQGDGRFFVAGVDSTGDLHRAIMRLEPVGVPDTTWAPGGMKHLSGTSSQRFYLDHYSLAFTPDGGLVSAYHSYAGTERQTVVEAFVSRIARVRAAIATPLVKGTVGTPIDYTVRAVNDGPNASGNGTLAISVSEGLRITGWAGGECTLDPRGGTCRFGSLAAGESKSIVLRVRAVSAGSHDMSATVDAAIYDDDTSNDSTSVSHPFEEPPTPAAAAAAGGADQEPSTKPTPAKPKVLRLTLVRIARFDGRVLRGCGTARAMCNLARVRAGRRTSDAYLRVNANVAGRRTLLLVMQTKVRNRWVQKYRYRLPLGDNGGLDVKLPTDWRAKPGTWRIRTQTIPPRGKRATVSGWMMYRVR